MNEFIGVGVDLISRSRAERFLREQSFESLERILTPLEQATFRTARSDVDFFARAFSAKEAYFKSCGQMGMGEEGFRKIETLFEEGEKFRIAGDPRAEGCFFETPGGIGAKVILWKSGQPPTMQEGTEGARPLFISQ